MSKSSSVTFLWTGQLARRGVSTDGNNSTGSTAEVVGLAVVMRVMVGRCYYPWTESYGDVRRGREASMVRDLASLLPAWCALATGKGHACIASGERGRRQLYLEGSTWVGLLLRLHVQKFKKGKGPLCKCLY